MRWLPLLQGGRPRILVVVLLFLVAPVVFTLIASNPPSDCPVNICDPWLYTSEFQITAGLTIVTLSLLVFSILRQTDSRLLKHKVPAMLDKHLPPPFSYLFVILALVGAFTFMLFTMCDIYPLLLSIPAPLRKMVGETWAALEFLPGMNYGTGAFIVWGLTMLSLSLARGVARAAKYGVLLILFLTVVVLLFQPVEMTDHVANFAKVFAWSTHMVPGPTRGGGPIYLLSNWLVLVLTASLTMLSLARFLSKKAGVKP